MNNRDRIDEQVKIHDRFSLELKIGFVAKKTQKINAFDFNIWMFVPNSLDINRFTYSKDDFYKDLTSHIRLITPLYPLARLANSQVPPFSSLEHAIRKLQVDPDRSNKANFEYQLKMLLSMLKSSLREEINLLSVVPADNCIARVQDFADQTAQIVAHYRSLKQKLPGPDLYSESMDYYQFGDEFISNLIELYAFRLLQMYKEHRPEVYSPTKQILQSRIANEIQYKKEKGYLSVEYPDHHNNLELVFHLSMLKKYAESDLFLDVKKRKDGIWIEQVFLSLAAGLSMIFATYVAFSFQQRYGNFTMPVFVALVVSYMLKDRIKELMRYYFAHKLNKRYFDHQIKISTNNHTIGWVKESMDFIAERNVPEVVLKKRNRSSILEANNRASNERIILFRTLMQLDREKINDNFEYPIAGVNEILRLNLSNFLQKMDNSEFPLYFPDDREGFKIVMGERVYYLNLILQTGEGESCECKRYRIVFNRQGIHKIETFDQC